MQELSPATKAANPDRLLRVICAIALALSIGAISIWIDTAFGLSQARQGDPRSLAYAPEPNVGLTWFADADPTSSGVPAPMWQFLVRTDAPSLYYKSGSPATAWTKIGDGSGGGGGGVTGSGIKDKAPVWTGDTSIGNGWPTDDGIKWGTPGIFTINETSGDVSAAGELAGSSFGLAAHVTTTISSDANNVSYVSSGHRTSFLVMTNPTTDGITITGFDANGAGAQVGDELWVLNDPASTGNYGFSEEDTNSAPGNRMIGTGPLFGFISPGQAAMFVYYGGIWCAL